MHRFAIKEKKRFIDETVQLFSRILLTGRQTISWRWLSVATSTSGMQKTVSLIEVAVFTYRLQTRTSKINLHRDIVSKKFAGLDISVLVKMSSAIRLTPIGWLQDIL
jgi:hypothetical protein